MGQGSSFFKQLYRWKVHHILLWLGYFSFWTTVYRGYYPNLLPLFITTGIYMVFNALAFYLIAYYLVGKFLSEGKILLFALLAIGAVLLCSAGLGFGLFLMFRGVKEVEGNMEYIVMGAFTSTVLVVGTLTSIKLIIEKIRSDRNSKQVEKQRLESELQYLKAQVNPHFLFNAINSVYILIKKDPDMASETLIKLSDLLRFQLYDCSDDKIPIEKEMMYLQNYIGLEKLRKGEKVKVDVKMEGNLFGFQIAPFLLMPFLENTFKFVSNHSSQSNQINISLVKEDRQLVATFYNTREALPSNGVGGIGLKNVRRRLELLYPEKHTLKIDQSPDSFQASLTLTLA